MFGTNLIYRDVANWVASHFSQSEISFLPGILIKYLTHEKFLKWQKLSTAKLLNSLLTGDILAFSNPPNYKSLDFFVYSKTFFRCSA